MSWSEDRGGSYRDGDRRMQHQGRGRGGPGRQVGPPAATAQAAAQLAHLLVNAKQNPSIIQELLSNAQHHQSQQQLQQQSHPHGRSSVSIGGPMERSDLRPSPYGPGSRDRAHDSAHRARPSFDPSTSGNAAKRTRHPDRGAVDPRDHDPRRARLDEEGRHHASSAPAHRYERSRDPHDSHHHHHHHHHQPHHDRDHHNSSHHHQHHADRVNPYHATPPRADHGPYDKHRGRGSSRADEPVYSDRRGNETRRGADARGRGKPERKVYPAPSNDVQITVRGARRDVRRAPSPRDSRAPAPQKRSRSSSAHERGDRPVATPPQGSGSGSSSLSSTSSSRRYDHHKPVRGPPSPPVRPRSSSRDGPVTRRPRSPDRGRNWDRPAWQPKKEDRKRARVSASNSVFWERKMRGTMTLPYVAYTDIRAMFPRLYLCNDFLGLIPNWADGLTGSAEPKELVDMTKSVPVHFLNVPPLEPLGKDFTRATEVNGTRYTSRIMLMSGASQEGDLAPNSKALPHRLQFLVKSVNRAWAPVGGPWNADADGCNEDGTPSEAHLFHAGARNLKRLTGIDLTGCTEWVKLVTYELNRVKPRVRQVITMFIPAAWDCLPEREAFRKQWTAYVGVTKPLPRRTGFIVPNKVQNTSSSASMVSLHSLLEYDMNHRHEGTMELSLFAESFHNMMMCDTSRFIVQRIRHLMTAEAQQRKTAKELMAQAAPSVDPVAAATSSVAEQQDVDVRDDGSGNDKKGGNSVDATPKSEHSPNLHSEDGNEDEDDDDDHVDMYDDFDAGVGYGNSDDQHHHDHDHGDYDDVHGYGHFDNDADDRDQEDAVDEHASAKDGDEATPVKKEGDQHDAAMVEGDDEEAQVAAAGVGDNANTDADADVDAAVKASPRKHTTREDGSVKQEHVASTESGSSESKGKEAAVKGTTSQGAPADSKASSSSRSPKSAASSPSNGRNRRFSLSDKELDPSMFRACCLLDSKRAGTIRCGALMALFLATGIRLSRSEAEELVHWVHKRFPAAHQFILFRGLCMKLPSQ